ncbi:MAG: SusC/RagA family TonB-linked outer membrane protein [Gemmatimonadales bacterium]|nr:SusC/RagA family TonB-linked outer membrane protein [Gemmatimonadales bacterium]
MRQNHHWLRVAVTGAALALLAGAPPLVAQNVGTVSGTITDAATGQSLSDVRVTVVGSVLSITTDNRGGYRIANVPAGSVTLQARRIGYKALDKTVTVTAGQTATVDFALNASVVTLDEVIVSGTAGDTKRKAQSATVSEIGVSDIAQTAPIRTFAEILQSRVPGVSVSMGSGTSGASSQIRIRGPASISLSNEPIVYIDGIRVTSSNASLFFTGGQSTSRLSEFDPKEIESIEVVKGPAAATLYGADASAGVIQIISKKGRAGATRFSQNITAEYNKLEANFTPPSNFGNCTAALVAATSANPLCRGQAVGTLVSDNPLVREGGFIDGKTRGLSWSGSGGNGSNFGYYLHGAYEDEDGTTRNNAFVRRNARINVNWTPSAKLTLDASIGLNRANFDLPDNDNNVYGYLGGGLLGTPLTRNDTGAESNNGWFGFARDVAAIALIQNQQQTHRTISTMTANFLPFPWFSNRFTVGADWLRDETRRFLPKNGRGSYQGVSNTGDISELREGTERYTVDYLGNVRFNTGSSLAHNVSAGFQLIDTRIENVQATGQGLTVNSTNLVSAASSRSAGQFYSRQKQVGFLGQWQGGWKDRLFLQVGARFDANSSFGNTSEWFFLPKVGGSYVVSDEAFWQNSLGFINTMRLRAAYGVTGRSPTPGASLTTLSPAAYIDPNAAALQPGATLQNPGNDSLKAERGSEFELGFDAGFLNDRVGVEFTFYNKTSKDLLLQRPLPPSLGFTQNPFVNIGELRNKGLEIGLTAQPIVSRNVSWDVRVGVSTLDSKVTDMGGVSPFGTLNRFMEGFQPGVFVGNRIRSINEQTGVVTVSDTLEAIGNLFPSFEGNVSTNLTLFRNVRIFASLDSKRDFYIYNNTDFFRETQLVRSDNRLNPTKLSAYERLRRYGNPTAGQPAFVREGKVAGQPATATVNEVRDAFVQKGDFTKLREVSVTYTFPTKVAGYFRAQGATVTLAGQNLALWSDYEGFDPEVISAATANYSRTDFLTIPPGRRFVVRFNVQF